MRINLNYEPEETAGNAGYEYEEDDEEIKEAEEAARLREAMANRQERYVDQKRKPVKKQRTVSKGLMIGLLVGVFVYFLVLYILSLTGVISRTAMLIASAPILIAAVAAYYIYRKRDGF